MNPGGDFGKRELSPALRNRFTEIWLPSVTSRADFLMLCESLLGKEAGLNQVAKDIVDFAMWFIDEAFSCRIPPLSTRDLVAWADFVKAVRLDLFPHCLFHPTLCPRIHTNPWR